MEAKILMVQKIQASVNPCKSTLYKRILGERQKLNDIKVLTHVKISIACYPKYR